MTNLDQIIKERVNRLPTFLDDWQLFRSELKALNYFVKRKERERTNVRSYVK